MKLRCCRGLEPKALVESVDHNNSDSVVVLVDREHRKHERLQVRVLDVNEYWDSEEEEYVQTPRDLIGKVCVMRPMAGLGLDEGGRVVVELENLITELPDGPVEFLDCRDLDRDPVSGE